MNFLLLIFIFVKTLLMKKITLLLTRHGETIENKKNILQGQLPGTLSELGIQQAEELAKRLLDVPLDVIISSDLSRSYKTAEIVAKAKGMHVVPTPLLREMHWGGYTGDSFEKVDWYNLPFGVESLEELDMRAGEFVNYLRVKYPGKRILAIGHGAFNRAVLNHLEGRRPIDMLEKPIMGNTEMVELTC